MRESFLSDGIWTHSLGGGRRRNFAEAGVDGKWCPEVTSSRYPVQSNG